MAKDLLETASEILENEWTAIMRAARDGALRAGVLDEVLSDSIRRSLNSDIKSYRYVLPTQLVAKLASPDLDCRCLQVARGGPGAFDARTLAHKVIVPFDQANDHVLGGSPEPYVNKPLRCPEVSCRYRTQQRNRDAWDCLCRVLDAVETKKDRSFTELVFRQVLTEIYRRLAAVSVSYAVPRRMSLERCMSTLREFLSEPSGGDRLLAATSALFLMIGRKFRLYPDIRRGTITTADAASWLVADLECVSDSGEVVMAVEVKDRQLTVSQMRSKIPEIRQRSVSEVFFVAQQGVMSSDREEASRLVEREFAGGQNLYIMDFFSLAGTVLALLGESGRAQFAAEVGRQLDTYRSDIAHRRKWAYLLRAI